MGDRVRSPLAAGHVGGTCQPLQGAGDSCLDRKRGGFPHPRRRLLDGFGCGLQQINSHLRVVAQHPLEAPGGDGEDNRAAEGSGASGIGRSPQCRQRADQVPRSQHVQDDLGNVLARLHTLGLAFEDQVVDDGQLSLAENARAGVVLAPREAGADRLGSITRTDGPATSAEERKAAAVVGRSIPLIARRMSFSGPSCGRRPATRT